jgi:hypothetical protein
MDLDVDKVPTFLSGLVEYLKMRHGDLLEGIARTGALSMECDRDLGAAVEAYKALQR